MRTEPWAGIECATESQIVDHEPPALEEVAHRLGQINEGVLQGLIQTREFLGRCGKPIGAKGASGADNAKPAGHIADINCRLSDIEANIKSLIEATGALRSIG